MPGARVGNGKSVTLKVECLLLLDLWAPEVVMLCACFFEVPQVNIFLLLCLKLTESNICMCTEAHTPEALSSNNGVKKHLQLSAVT